MKKYIKILILIFIAVFTIASVKYNSSEYISNKTWKHYGGYSSGDLIEYSKQKEGGLKMNGKSAAAIKFCFNRYLIVKNNENGKYGYYILKKGISK